MDRTSDPRVPFDGTSRQPVLHLEVRRGLTAVSDRPVVVRRFLIGADPLCELCLGADDLPPLHSIVLTTDEGIWIEAVAPNPELRVNGTAVTEYELSEGDVVEIGAFELVATWRPAIAGTIDPPSPLARLALEDDGPEIDFDDLESVPVSELVTLIEQEEALLDEFVVRQSLGADALLFAALERAHALEDAEENETTLIAPFLTSAVPESDSFPQREVAATSEIPEIPQLTDVPADFETLVSHLTGIADELNSRADRLARRERVYADAAASLLEAQQRLTDQMEGILSRLAALETPQTKPARNVA